LHPVTKEFSPDFYYALQFSVGVSPLTVNLLSDDRQPCYITKMKKTKHIKMSTIVCQCLLFNTRPSHATIMLLLN
jgi:hypothetical protein